ncbi:AAA family ATPase [Gluconobacter kanchanaburiensis]|uniref:ATPase n=1 Tax=Gluconobacter kanchanaburiensis NBRC 103587 TaxID=1307948 RepID=A0A511B5R1_9PROT|nr:MoxR family ATPase [Gluconobacter kanchanaburiensis]MBF0861407.1 MoxR family ATPase [Gluconobacter kanchanaburiensis]GBR68235.1 MoxR family transcriptional regulator [Gluconobacter kanchanaburiensis NBRC 103587]GEK95769.1 ATPase [Gluconobacter kanchanaburiensis NBRC 103587]
MSEQQYSSGVSAGTQQGEADVAEADRLAPVLRQIRQAIGEIVLGQDAVIEQVLVTILSGGHALLMGAPGLGKTLLVNTASRVLGLDATRIQFTPDLMPSDITGAEILDQDAEGRRAFRFLPGPVFGQLVLADEINRASPRTQSALLQAMAERRVTQGGKDYTLPRPFHVLATQNPIEQEGTYPLPEAQLDRFMLQIGLGFPDRAAERQMLLQTTGATTPTATPLMDAASILAAQNLVRRLPVGEQVVDAILTLTRSLRPEDPSSSPEVREAVSYGPGPRAAQALMIATRARALLDGRLAPSLDDVAALAIPVLSHRIGLGFGARASGAESEALIRKQAQAIF